MTPPEIVHTARTVVRRETSADAAPVAVAISDNLDRLAVWMDWAVLDATTAVAQLCRIIRTDRQWDLGTAFDYIIVDASDGSVLGKIGLPRRSGSTVELGYWLTAAAEGHGYATEATAALRDEVLGVDGVTHVEILCDTANLRSNAVPRRLGFRLDRVEDRPVVTSGQCGRTAIWRYPTSG